MAPCGRLAFAGILPKQDGEKDPHEWRLVDGASRPSDIICLRGVGKEKENGSRKREED